MKKKERFIINLILQRIGLSEVEATKLTAKLEEKGIKYEKIIKKKMNIYPLVEYCRKNDYSNRFMNEIISVAIKNRSARKILNIDKVLKENNYSKEEREYIETKDKEIFKNSAETLNNKIKYYDDNNLRKIIIINPRGLSISLDIAHARIELFKSKRLSLNNNSSRLFEDNIKFKYHFSVTNEDLKRMYPLPEKYLIKNK